MLFVAAQGSLVDGQSHVVALLLAIGAISGVLGLVIKELVSVFSKRKDEPQRDSHEERLQEQFRKDIYTFTSEMMSIHRINPATGKVDMFCAMSTHGPEMIALLKKQNGQLDRVADALINTNQSFATLINQLQSRPCQIPDVLDRLVPRLRQAEAAATEGAK